MQSCPHLLLELSTPQSIILRAHALMQQVVRQAQHCAPAARHSPPCKRPECRGLAQRLGRLTWMSISASSEQEARVRVAPASFDIHGHQTGQWPVQPGLAHPGKQQPVSAAARRIVKIPEDTAAQPTAAGTLQNQHPCRHLSRPCSSYSQCARSDSRQHWAHVVTTGQLVPSCSQCSRLRLQTGQHADRPL